MGTDRTSGTSARTDTDAFRLLVVDDNASIRLLVRRLAERSGMEVVAEATCGGEAVEFARAHQPDAILLDVAMPNVDGPTALPDLAEVAPGSRIVMYSDRDDHRRLCFERGAHAWVGKTTPWAEIRKALVGAES